MTRPRLPTTVERTTLRDDYPERRREPPFHIGRRRAPPDLKGVTR